MEGEMDGQVQEELPEDVARELAVPVDESDGDSVIESAFDERPADAVAELLAALEGADDLPIDERLELLRSAEASIAGVLEGLDGL
jgi:hypothetical protein